MDTTEARKVAQAFIGNQFIATAVQTRGENFYVSYRPTQGDSRISAAICLLGVLGFS